MNTNPNYMSSVGGGGQSIPMKNTMVAQNSSILERVPAQYSSMAPSSVSPGWNRPNPAAYNVQSSKSNFDALVEMCEQFHNILPIPKNATNTVYIEGIPLGTKEREVAHIFRPFPGFRSIRLINRDKKNGDKVIYCFADFENTLQTTMVINTLQGYRFDKNDDSGLHFSYSKVNNKLHKDHHHRSKIDRVH